MYTQSNSLNEYNTIAAGYFAEFSLLLCTLYILYMFNC